MDKHLDFLVSQTERFSKLLAKSLSGPQAAASASVGEPSVCQALTAGRRYAPSARPSLLSDDGRGSLGPTDGAQRGDGGGSRKARSRGPAASSAAMSVDGASQRQGTSAASSDEGYEDEEEEDEEETLEVSGSSRH